MMLLCGVYPVEKPVVADARRALDRCRMLRTADARATAVALRMTALDSIKGGHYVEAAAALALLKCDAYRAMAGGCSAQCGVDGC
jgi:hypothetical protein